MSPCTQCGREFERPSRRGPAPQYCSPACRQAAHRERKTEPPLTQWRRHLMELGEFMETIQDSVAGYRSALQRLQYPSVVVDQMSVAYHAFVLDMVVRQMGATK
ncbi:hypothetical protein [Desertimonas flava]|uniref:hypothetical protein n=1 Tax=Desertimonas flava TaxID=2064846 RepID=UPI0013C44331|nr:hypothetical protein [Desertimonas flava]